DGVRQTGVEVVDAGVVGDAEVGERLVLATSARARFVVAGALALASAGSAQEGEPDHERAHAQQPRPPLAPCHSIPPDLDIPSTLEAKHLMGGRCYPALLIRCDDEERGLLGEKPDAGTALRPQIGGFPLLDHPVDSVALRRVEDAASAEPECDVRRLPLVAVRDEVARP